MIKAMLLATDPELFKLYPTLREAFEEGELKGELKGVERERRELLSEAFAEQAGRAPTLDEQEALAKRATEMGAKRALRALLKLHGDALVGWLLGQGTTRAEGTGSSPRWPR